MARRSYVRVEGFRECAAALGELPRAVSHRVVSDTLKEAGEIVAAGARLRAPWRTRRLARSFKVGTQLSRAQRALHIKQSEVEVFIGPAPLPQAITQEFGTAFHRPQPTLRPEWESKNRLVLYRIRDRLASRIEAARQRLARRTARYSRT